MTKKTTAPKGKPTSKVAKKPAKRPAKKPTKPVARPPARPVTRKHKPAKHPAKHPAKAPVRHREPKHMAVSQATGKVMVEESVKRDPFAKSKFDVYFNGRIISEIKHPESFVDNLRKKRRMGLISHQLNVAYHPEFGEIRINTSHGRTRRPLIIVENGKPKLSEKLLRKLDKGEISWSYLIQHGIIEYLDAEEEENTLIALREENVTKNHTHLEIDPMIILGTSAALIPYPEYNRGDRINYGAKMVGQAIGLMSSNFPVRADTKFNILSYPQAPLVRTNISDILDEYPEGQNVVVAIMCHDGYNLNDAIVMNKSSIQRGLFRSLYFRTYETIKKKYWGGQEDEITVPEPGIKGYLGEDAYADLAADGIINPEIHVKSDSVMVGKVSPLRFLSSEDFASDIENRRETSVTVRYGEEGMVDDVLISETTDADQLIKVRIRDQRILDVGDKLASRHGQKGVISLLVPQEDMPFSSEGIIPDLIFNPHAIPSRMTIGQLLELLSGKMGALAGKDMDASAFSHVREDDIRKTMKSLGFRDDGKQALYDGKKGTKYDVMIFTGLTYYMKLDHMVTDKIHARSRGPVTLLTKQPTEGRAKRGGLRLGEMEQQCLVGHGAVLALKERFDSDKTMIPICNKCGLVAIHDKVKNRSYCGMCKDSEVAWVETSYAFKLTLDELKSMGIYPKLGTQEV